MSHVMLPEAFDTPAALVEALFDLYETRGRCHYDGGVDQVEHARQAAALAQADGAPPYLVVAALLHDVGHLLVDDSEDPGDPAPSRRDHDHEVLGARFLYRWFPASVMGPVALHVRAKRYLVAVEPGYLAGLSEASRRSLELQGGPLQPAEADAFATLPHTADALALRRWDDRAKIAGRESPPLAAFADLVRSQVRPLA